jgi:hypothetical protein
LAASWDRHGDDERVLARLPLPPPSASFPESVVAWRKKEVREPSPVERRDWDCGELDCGLLWREEGEESEVRHTPPTPPTQPLVVAIRLLPLAAAVERIEFRAPVGVPCWGDEVADVKIDRSWFILFFPLPETILGCFPLLLRFPGAELVGGWSSLRAAPVLFPTVDCSSVPSAQPILAPVVLVFGKKKKKVKRLLVLKWICMSSLLEIFFFSTIAIWSARQYFPSVFGLSAVSSNHSRKQMWEGPTREQQTMDALALFTLSYQKQKERKK